MKKVIAVVLTMATLLVMLFAVSAPALAKPSKLEQLNDATGKGQVSIRQDRYGYPIISVSLRRAAPNETFKIVLQCFESINDTMPVVTHPMGSTLLTNSMGAGRFKVACMHAGTYPEAKWIRVWVLTKESLEDNLDNLEDMLVDIASYKTPDLFPFEFTMAQ